MIAYLAQHFQPQKVGEVGNKPTWCPDTASIGSKQVSFIDFGFHNSTQADVPRRVFVALELTWMFEGVI